MEITMRTAHVRAGWFMSAAATLGMVVSAPAQRDRSPVGARGVAAGATPAPGKVTEAQARQAEMQVELAWLANPQTFPCMLAAHVESGAMVVGGEVPSAAVRQEVITLARKQGGLPVVDRLTIKPSAMPAPARANDAALCRQAVAALSKACPDCLDNVQLEASEHGQLIVKGTIPTYERKLAISRRLSQLAGCTCVQNQLVVGQAPVAIKAPVPAAMAAPKVAANAGPSLGVAVAVPRSPAVADAGPRLLPPAPVPVEAGPALTPPAAVKIKPVVSAPIVINAFPAPAPSRTAEIKPAVCPPVAIGSANKPVLPGDAHRAAGMTRVAVPTSTGTTTILAPPTRVEASRTPVKASKVTAARPLTTTPKVNASTEPRHLAAQPPSQPPAKVVTVQPALSSGSTPQVSAPVVNPPAAPAIPASPYGGCTLPNSAQPPVLQKSAVDLRPPMTSPACWGDSSRLSPYAWAASSSAPAAAPTSTEPVRVSPYGWTNGVAAPAKVATQAVLASPMPASAAPAVRPTCPVASVSGPITQTKASTTSGTAQPKPEVVQAVALSPATSNPVKPEYKTATASSAGMTTTPSHESKLTEPLPGKVAMPAGPVSPIPASAAPIARPASTVVSAGGPVTQTKASTTSGTTGSKLEVVQAVALSPASGNPVKPECKTTTASCAGRPTPPTTTASSTAALTGVSSPVVPQRVAPYEWASSWVYPPKPTSAATVVNSAIPSPTPRAPAPSTSVAASSQISKCAPPNSGPILQTSATAGAPSKNDGPAIVQAGGMACSSALSQPAAPQGMAERPVSMNRPSQSLTVAQAATSNGQPMQTLAPAPLPKVSAPAPQMPAAPPAIMPVAVQQMPAAPPAIMPAAVQQMLQQRIEGLCVDKAWEVRVEPRSSSAVAIHMKVRDPMAGKELGRQIMRLPELGPYQVKMEVLVIP
jgi:hypothetical protein